MSLIEWTTEALIAELRRRQRVGDDAPEGDAAVIVGGLEVDPVGCVATWRGRAVRITPMPCAVLYALALARFQGRRLVRVDALAVSVYRTAGSSEVACVRVLVGELRKQLPGLVVTRLNGRNPGYYGLALDDAKEDAA